MYPPLVNKLVAVTLLQSFVFFKIFMYRGGGATVRFAPVVPWAKIGPAFSPCFNNELTVEAH
jgi:hypothetical protein